LKHHHHHKDENDLSRFLGPTDDEIKKESSKKAKKRLATKRLNEAK